VLANHVIPYVQEYKVACVEVLLLVLIVCIFKLKCDTGSFALARRHVGVLWQSTSSKASADKPTARDHTHCERWKVHCHSSESWQSHACGLWGSWSAGGKYAKRKLYMYLSAIPYT